MQTLVLVLFGLGAALAAPAGQFFLVVPHHLVFNQQNSPFAHEISVPIVVPIGGQGQSIAKSLSSGLKPHPELLVGESKLGKSLSSDVPAENTESEASLTEHVPVEKAEVAVAEVPVEADAPAEVDAPAAEAMQDGGLEEEIPPMAAEEIAAIAEDVVVEEFVAAEVIDSIQQTAVEEEMAVIEQALADGDIAAAEEEVVAIQDNAAMLKQAIVEEIVAIEEEAEAEVKEIVEQAVIMDEVATVEETAVAEEQLFVEEQIAVDDPAVEEVVAEEQVLIEDPNIVASAAGDENAPLEATAEIVTSTMLDVETVNPESVPQQDESAVEDTIVVEEIVPVVEEDIAFNGEVAVTEAAIEDESGNEAVTEVVTEIPETFVNDEPIAEEISFDESPVEPVAVVIDNIDVIAEDAPVMSEDAPVMIETSPVMSEDTPVMIEDAPVMAEEDAPVMIEDAAFIAEEVAPLMIEDDAFIAEEDALVMTEEDAPVMAEETIQTIPDELVMEIVPVEESNLEALSPVPVDPILPTAVKKREPSPFDVLDTMIAEAMNEVKPESFVKTKGSGKSLLSSPVAQKISHSSFDPVKPAINFGFPRTHFIFQEATPAPVRFQNSFVDPRSLVHPQFRHFIYENDSADVIKAKIKFFQVQAAHLPPLRF